ncbi:protein of unknown function [Methylorubrum extorquens DM4]|uniref:Uncharacterized protein n=1 Tax=Methylorubrum extorquens (strain DSM 6343 / CIP 106787 / DM4) TaxID=661410 RepID=C7CD39_METED|nr:hypothetical protein [Methylorubrum extorquens]CAX22567.1 protein of unknown function [Methylorubrum extorquens DM4]
MRTLQPTLFDEVSAHLPLFDGLSEEAAERLAAGGYGRGLLTASLRARLRKAGFADMAALALASPVELMAVRKIGPVRVSAIRAHLLRELARLVPGARAGHDSSATDRRRLERLRAMPGERFGWAGETCADLAVKRCADIRAELNIPAADLDRIAAALTRALLPERPRVPSVAAAPEGDAAPEITRARERAELLREQDRQWDAAAPEADIRPGRVVR